MTKKVLIFSCLLGLIFSLPALANPTNKTITLTCSSGSPDVIIGEVDVTLYDTTGTLSVDCGLLDCDSSGGLILPGVPSTNSRSCTTAFRVYDMSYVLNYTDYDYDTSTNPATVTVIGSSNNGAVSGVILKGSGFSTQIAPNTADIVTLKVK